MLCRPSFLNVDLLSRTLSEFKWPYPYEIIDDMPDGIIVSFPKSNFVFTEGPEGEVVVHFLPEDVKSQVGLHLGHALSVFVPLSQRTSSSVTPGLIKTEDVIPSEEMVKNGIRNACTIMLTHMLPVIGGDFSWVDTYLANRGNPEST